MPAALGQATGTGRDPTEVFFWCAVLLGVAFLMGLTFWIIRKKLMSADDDTAAEGLGLGFTLSDLRQMHAEGQMTDDEFEYAKRKMAARAKAEIDGVDPDEAGDDPPVVEDLGDISAVSENAAEGPAADDPDPAPDKDDDFGGDSGADPDKIEDP
ncbi:MAG: hypothetical protein AAF333_18750 [Planctomycetota bacterium]